MMKKFFAALLSLVMILSLVACGSSKPTEPPAQETPGAPEVTEPAEPEKATEPEKAKGVVYLEGDIQTADYYDIVVEFEQGTKPLAGVPAAFDKVSLKDGGASIADEANGVKYVTSKSGAECNSDSLKFQ